MALRRRTLRHAGSLRFVEDGYGRKLGLILADVTESRSRTRRASSRVFTIDGCPNPIFRETTPSGILNQKHEPVFRLVRFHLEAGPRFRAPALNILFQRGTRVCLPAQAGPAGWRGIGGCRKFRHPFSRPLRRTPQSGSTRRHHLATKLYSNCVTCYISKRASGFQKSLQADRKA